MATTDNSCCLLMDWDEMSNLYRGPSKDASYQVSVYLDKRLKRRRFLEIDQSETRTVKLLCQMNRNLIGSIYGRSSIGISHFVLICRQTWPPCLNRTYGKIAGFWVITQKPLIKTEIWHVVKMCSMSRSTYPAIQVLAIAHRWAKKWSPAVVSSNTTIGNFSK
jgi:hypothetical protein